MNQMVTCMNSTLSGLRTRFTALRANLKKFSKDNCGEGYLDLASAPVDA